MTLKHLFLQILQDHQVRNVASIDHTWPIYEENIEIIASNNVTNFEDSQALNVVCSVFTSFFKGYYTLTRVLNPTKSIYMYMWCLEILNAKIMTTFQDRRTKKCINSVSKYLTKRPIFLSKWPIFERSLEVTLSDQFSKRFVWKYDQDCSQDFFYNLTWWPCFWPYESLKIICWLILKKISWKSGLNSAHKVFYDLTLWPRFFSILWSR